MRQLRRDQWADIGEWDVRQSILEIVLRRTKQDAGQTAVNSPVNLSDAILIEPSLTDISPETLLDISGSSIVGSVKLDSVLTDELKMQGIIVSGDLVLDTRWTSDPTIIQAQEIEVLGRARIYWQLGTSVTFANSRFHAGLEFEEQVIFPQSLAESLTDVLLDFDPEGLGSSTLASTRRTDPSGCKIDGPLQFPPGYTYVDNANLSNSLATSSWVGFNSEVTHLIANRNTVWPPETSEKLEAEVHIVDDDGADDSTHEQSSDP